MSFFSDRRAANLHSAGLECSETGNEEGAIENYTKALALDPKRGETLYNLGLIYKYRGDWPKSFEFNARAREFQRDDEAMLWNLAIAATALRDWSAAREVWRTLKAITEDGEGPIHQDMGQTPVRINAEGIEDRPTEVVWSERLCPVRSRIINIPTGATGFRFRDVVLHDGAPVGYRLNSYGKERAVFNVLELFEPSRFGTYEASLEAASSEILGELERACESTAIQFEDWTASLKNLCRACSEGRPHEGHDQELKEPKAWATTRRIGIAALDRESLDIVLREWAAKPGRSVAEVRCTLEAGSHEGSKVMKRLMPEGTLLGLGIGAGIALAFLLGVAVPGVAQAQMLICASHSLNRDDASRLKVAARAVVLNSSHVWVEGACINPGSALGFVETQKIVTAEGVQQWWTMTCHRDAKDWECDVPGFKQFIATSLEVGGKSQAVELHFDKESSLEHVRTLAARAIEIYEDPASRLPPCGTKRPKESDQLGQWDHHDPLPTGDNAIHVSVSKDARDSVTLDDVSVAIEFRSNGEDASPEAACWGIEVIVT